MNKTDTLFVTALRKVVEDEYRFVPAEDDIEHEFSERFIKKINKIYLPDEKPVLFFLQQNRVAVLILVLIILLFSFGCAVPQIREEVQDYFVTIYKNNFIIFWKDSTIATSMDNYYLPTDVPEGFALVNYGTNEEVFSALYEKISESGKREKIELYQQLIPKDGLRLWKEYSTLEKIEMNGLNMKIYKSLEIITILYEYEGYVFRIRCRESIQINDIAAMLSSLEKIDS